MGWYLKNKSNYSIRRCDDCGQFMSYNKLMEGYNYRKNWMSPHETETFLGLYEVRHRCFRCNHVKGNLIEDISHRWVDIE